MQKGEAGEERGEEQGEEGGEGEGEEKDRSRRRMKGQGRRKKEIRERWTRGYKDSTIDSSMIVP